MQKSIALVLVISTLSPGLAACDQWSIFQSAPSFEENSAFIKETNQTTVSFTTCKIDTTEVPEAESDRELLLTLCQDYYARIRQMLGSDGAEQPSSIQIRLKKGRTDQVADVSGGTISLYENWFMKHQGDPDRREIKGVLAHEMTHIMQAYKTEVPQWVVEGIADYVRHAMGLSDKSAVQCEDGKHYEESVYRCAPAFLTYVEESYPGTIAQINTQFRTTGYDADFFTQVTGKPLDQLWQECLGTTWCSGGREALGG
ncbi:basic secretory protein-like protein [Thermoleptolyngbya sp. C42_A2020_037]|uniref:basic secretory protein-like protein n=1 Tax=Thermoleptolyngbya sp. C42_A2020_037 TaxID=2747799 RepID=UPI0019EA4787|nr:basic secretory protein-like protein [Thermoleptolyngbya sp. C42_A2020_037]MBF2085461.1 hypothetical protein [Thermoleptolyngbya sp. C42_A2020_037]